MQDLYGPLGASSSPYRVIPSGGARAEPRATRSETGRRAKRFVFVIDRYIGHLNGTLGLAQRLYEAGNQVIYIVAPSAAHHFRGQPFDVISFKWLEGTRKQRSFADALFRRGIIADRRNARLMAIQADIALFVERNAPDLIVFDPFLLKYLPFFAKMGAKCVSVSTKPLLTRSPMTPPYTSTLVPRNGKAGELRVALAWKKQELSYLWYCLKESVNHLIFADNRWLEEAAIEKLAGCKFRRIDRHVRFDMRYAGVPEIVLQAREFDFPREPENLGPAIFVGPCVRQSADTLDISEFVPEGDGPLVLCSLGTVRRTSHAHIVAFYLNVIKALGNSEYRLVIAAGSAEDVAAIKMSDHLSYSNVQVHPWIPQQEILKACSLLITHGGGGSLKEAFTTGVPALVYPMRADQPGCGARVKFHGLGESSSLKRATPRSIRRAVEALLQNERYKANCKNLAETYRRYDAERTAISVLTRLATPMCDHNFDGEKT